MSLARGAAEPARAQPAKREHEAVPQCQAESAR